MYELIFETDPIEETLQDLIDEQFDALISGHGPNVFISMSAEGDTAVEAALHSAAALGRLGVHVRRLVEDLVTRTDIAQRTKKTPQAVGAWVRGDRQAADPFPTPYNYVAGGVWLWGEVNEWLARVTGEADDVNYPSRHDYAFVNGVLTAPAVAWTHTVAPVAWAHSSAGATTPAVDLQFHSGVELRIGEQPSPKTQRAPIDESWDSFSLAG